MLHPTEKYYPLRPEFAESTFYLYQATKGLVYFPFSCSYFKVKFIILGSYACVYCSVNSVEHGGYWGHVIQIFITETRYPAQTLLISNVLTVR